MSLSGEFIHGSLKDLVRALSRDLFEIQYSARQNFIKVRQINPINDPYCFWQNARPKTEDL